MSPLRRRTVRRVLFVGVAVAAVVVVVLVALVAAGVLVIPSSSPAPVTITSVHLMIEEGDAASGVPWFGTSSINETNGYPLQVTPGGSWTVPWPFINLDIAPHSVYKVIPTSVPGAPPGKNFTIAGFTVGLNAVTLPYTVPAGGDGTLSTTVTAPNDPGATFAVTLTVDTFSIS